MSSSQRYNSEPSLSQRRGLAIETASPRQLVESKGTLQSIPIFASNNPLKREKGGQLPPFSRFSNELHPLQNKDTT